MNTSTLYAILLGTSIVACSGNTSSELDPPAMASLDELRTHIAAMIEPPSCSSTAECRAMAFGAKPCGGPWTYLVYSVTRTDTATLAEWVQRYNAREADLNRKEGRLSDCMLVAEPQPVCVQGQCVARP